MNDYQDMDLNRDEYEQVMQDMDEALHQSEVSNADVMGMHVEYVLNNVCPQLSGRALGDCDIELYVEMMQAIRECHELQTLYPENTANELVPEIAEFVNDCCSFTCDRKFDFVKMYHLMSNDALTTSNIQRDLHDPRYDMPWRDKMGAIHGLKPNDISFDNVPFDRVFERRVELGAIWTNDINDLMNQKIIDELEALNLQAEADAKREAQLYFEADMSGGQGMIADEASAFHEQSTKKYYESMNDFYGRVYCVDCMGSKDINHAQFGIHDDVRKKLGVDYERFCAEYKTRTPDSTRIRTLDGINLSRSVDSKTLDKIEEVKHIVHDKSIGTMKNRRLPAEPMVDDDFDTVMER